MGATSTQSTKSLAKQLASEYPAIHFAPGTDFAWHPGEQTVSYTNDTSSGAPQLLHELSHAILGHTTYTRDIELLRIERQAWEHALTLAPRYHVAIDEETIETALDTYREWLHRRSTCPSCQLNGVQESRTTYRCVHCLARWSVNEARTCRLRRAPLHPTK